MNSKIIKFFAVFLLAVLVGVLCGGFAIGGYIGIAMGVTGILLSIFWIELALQYFGLL